MTYPSWLYSFSFRHAVSVTVAVFSAALMSNYFSMSHEGWMVVTAFLVSQTTRGTPLRQGINYFFVTIIAILISMLMQMYVSDADMLTVFAVCIFYIASCIIYIKRPLTNRTLYLLMLFPLVILIAILTPIKYENAVYARFVDAMLGGAIGVVSVQLIFPVRFESEFRHGLIPLLVALKNYSRELIDCLVDDKKRDSLNEKRQLIESALQSQQGVYPEWVYEVGFNPGLRGGFRFFLVNIERVTELYFSLDCLARSGLDVGIMQELSRPLAESIRKNMELLSVLIEYLSNVNVVTTESSYTSDIAELEETLRRNIPASLELLDISPEYVKLTAFVRDIKDLREILLQLVLALPNS